MSFISAVWKFIHDNWFSVSSLLVAFFSLLVAASNRKEVKKANEFAKEANNLADEANYIASEALMISRKDSISSITITWKGLYDEKDVVIIQPINSDFIIQHVSVYYKNQGLYLDKDGTIKRDKSITSKVDVEPTLLKLPLENIRNYITYLLVHCIKYKNNTIQTPRELCYFPLIIVSNYVAKASRHTDESLYYLCFKYKVIPREAHASLNISIKFYGIFFIRKLERYDVDKVLFQELAEQLERIRSINYEDFDIRALFRKK